MTDQDIELLAGDDKRLVVTIYEDGAVKDISNFTAVYKLANPKTKAVIVQKTTSSGIALTTPASGVLTITLDAADTANLGGEYLHQCRITDVLSKTNEVFSGNVFIRRAL